MALRTLTDLLVHELRDLYDAENQLLAALPRLEKRVRNDELRMALKEHHHLTNVQRHERSDQRGEEAPPGGSGGREP